MNDQMDQENKEKKTFIRETVEAPAKSKKKRLLVHVIVLVCAAVLFGLIACLTFVLSRPWLETHFGSGDVTEPSIVIPRDEEESSEAEETVVETVVDSEELEHEIESMVDERIDAYLETLEIAEESEIIDVYQKLASVQTILESSMVEVTSRSAGEDVFRNTFTRSEKTFGVITAKTDSGLLILTENTLIEEESAGVYVTVANETVDAQIHAVDRSLGMAMVLVQKDALSEEAWKKVYPAKLGNSYYAKQGTFVAALGNPLGYTGSALAGSVAYINSTQQGVDLNFQLIQTDMACDEGATGILLDETGAIIGWITQRYNSDSMSGMLAAISISELKGSLENLSNGRSNASMGIIYQALDSASAEELGLPEGLYIDRCVNNGVASLAGVQSGDILTRIDGNSITADRQFRQVMETKKPGDAVEITIMRQGKGELVEQTYELTLTAR